jgi:sensor histidine kinase YesM
MASLARFRNREYDVLVAQYESAAREATLARQLTEARLKLMQAQVEPHFLFNTLASVQQLAEEEGRAREAAQLTAQLISFLRAGLSGLREEKSTLQREFEMTRAYLSIMKTRMGERLHFSLDLPEALASCDMPPAMLISLVENAIKHGLEPKPEGGTLQVRAAREDGRLVLCVQDDGLGLSSGHRISGGGVGLSNIRERLQARFGEAASLSLAEAAPTGFIATITLPDNPHG